EKWILSSTYVIWLGQHENSSAMAMREMQTLLRQPKPITCLRAAQPQASLQRQAARNSRAARSGRWGTSRSRTGPHSTGEDTSCCPGWNVLRASHAAGKLARRPRGLGTALRAPSLPPDPDLLPA